VGRLKQELTDWVEDENGGQVMNGTRRKFSVAVDFISVRVEGG